MVTDTGPFLAVWEPDTCIIILFHAITGARLVSSLCIPYSTKSDIHRIIMNPPNG